MNECLILEDAGSTVFFKVTGFGGEIQSRSLVYFEKKKKFTPKKRQELKNPFELSCEG